MTGPFLRAVPRQEPRSVVRERALFYLRSIYALRQEREPICMLPWPAPTRRRIAGDQTLVPALNGEDEIETQPFRLPLVELGGRDKLVLCLWMKLNASHRSAERAFLMTLVAGILTTPPDFSSPSRRSASSSQSFSASISLGSSRLKIRRCARRARSLRDNFSALDSSSRSGSAMPRGYHRAGQTLIALEDLVHVDGHAPTHV